MTAPDERPADAQPAARITVYPDGPLIVRGDVLLEWLDGGRIPTGRTVALCRCGRSATKPLCDGSHKNSRKRRADIPAVRAVDDAEAIDEAP